MERKAQMEKEEEERKLREQKEREEAEAREKIAREKELERQKEEERKLQVERERRLFEQQAQKKDDLLKRKVQSGDGMTVEEFNEQMERWSDPRREMNRDKRQGTDRGSRKVQDLKEKLSEKAQDPWMLENIPSDLKRLKQTSAKEWERIADSCPHALFKFFDDTLPGKEDYTMGERLRLVLGETMKMEMAVTEKTQKTARKRLLSSGLEEDDDDEEIKRPPQKQSRVSRRKRETSSDEEDEEDDNKRRRTSRKDKEDEEPLPKRRRDDSDSSNHDDDDEEAEEDVSKKKRGSQKEKQPSRGKKIPKGSQKKAETARGSRSSRKKGSTVKVEMSDDDFDMYFRGRYVIHKHL